MVYEETRKIRSWYLYTVHASQRSKENAHGANPVNPTFLYESTDPNTSYHLLPACLLDTWKLTSESLHTELELERKKRDVSSRRYSGVQTCPSRAFTHSVESEIPEHTTGSTRGHTAVLDLCWAGVAVHLGQLKLGLGAGTLRKAGVANDVAECLSVRERRVRPQFQV